MKNNAIFCIKTVWYLKRLQRLSNLQSAKKILQVEISRNHCIALSGILKNYPDCRMHRAVRDSILCKILKGSLGVNIVMHSDFLSINNHSPYRFISFKFVKKAWQQVALSVRNLFKILRSSVPNKLLSLLFVVLKVFPFVSIGSLAFPASHYP